jgi:hypothetical protein
MQVLLFILSKLPVLRPLLDNKNDESVKLQENDEAVLACEEYVHVTDHSISEQKCFVGNLSGKLMLLQTQK